MDWLFGVAWVTERHLITGSRDKSVKLWQVAEEGPAMNVTPLHTALQHRVRPPHSPSNAAVTPISCPHQSRGEALI